MKYIYILFICAALIPFMARSQDEISYQTPVIVDLTVQDRRGEQVTGVQFNGKNLPLRSADLEGRRGTFHFKFPPGTYNLTWQIKKDPPLEKTVAIELDGQTNWVVIAIQGEQISLSTSY